jgi:hypothetical protein
MQKRQHQHEKNSSTTQENNNTNAHEKNNTAMKRTRKIAHKTLANITLQINTFHLPSWWLLFRKP